ncbi:MAG: hypothetical protein JXR53_00490 [Bacteroidales bacterium]|nr:hypothetical protein [Bacteroidales bacterium]
MKEIQLIAAFLLSFLGAFAQPYYVSEKGVISIEAEYFTSSNGEWEEVEGRNAEPMEKQGQGTVIQMGIVSGRFLNLSDKNISIGWGIPYENAEVTAYADNMQTKAVVFSYLPKKMAGDFEIPAYRAFICWPSLAYSEEGWSVFYNALIKVIRYNDMNKVLFVHGGETAGETDQKIIDWLIGQGIDVKTAPDESLGKIEIPQIPVIISESVSSGRVDTHFLKHPFPAIVGEPFVLNKMGMVKSKEPWQPVVGEFGNAVMVASPKPSDSLVYVIKMEGGIQQINVLAQSADKRTKETIDIALFSLETKQKLKAFKIELKPTLDWILTPKFEVEEGDYLLVIKPGEETFASYEMVKNRRYPSFRIDKIILNNATVSITGNGPSTRMKVLPEKLAQYIPAERFLPMQIWKATNGIVVVEAENIDHHANWQLRTEPKGYTGRGYLQWEGPSRAQSIEGLGGNDDDKNVRQGPQEQMLIIRIDIEEPGIYCVNARNIHELEDGDNDAWVSLLGFKPWNEDAFDDRVRRMGDSHKDGKGFTWLDWGVREFPLKKGINSIYIGGRSVGFAIDRIAVYPANNEDAMKRALKIDAQTSELK